MNLKKDKYLIFPKAISFFIVGFDAIWRNYNPIWFKDHGFGFFEIGMLRSFRIICSIFGPLWSIFADKTQKRREILTLIVIIYLIITKLIDKYSSTFENRIYMAIIFLCFNILWSGIKPVSEGLILAYLGEDKKLFGRQMTFMALGWLTCCIIAGYLYTWYGFYACWNLMVVIAFLLFFTMYGFMKNTEKEELEEINSIPFFVKLKMVIKKLNEAKVLKILAVLVVQGAGTNMIQTFLFVYLNNDLKAPEYICGWTIFFTCLIELPIYFYSHVLLNTFGINFLFILAQLAFVIRTFLYTFLTEENILWVLPIELLHGFTFANMWNSAAQFASDFCPKGLESVCMLILSFCHHYLGAAIGNLIAGLLYKYYGAIVMFHCFGSFALLTCLIFSYICFLEYRNNDQSYISEDKNELTIELIEKEKEYSQIKKN